jgi:hypothetical protein
MKTELLRFNGVVERALAIDPWMREHAGELGAIAHHWFGVMRKCGDEDLVLWMKTLPQPWSAAMEATIFTGWIYDHLKPHAAALKVAHPLMLRAIAAAKKKNDRIDANKICDCLLLCPALPVLIFLQSKTCAGVVS